MSLPVTICGTELPEKDAALSLCAMGHVFVLDQAHKTLPNDPTSPPSIEDDQSRTSDCSSVCRRRTKVKLPPKKRVAKRNESKRDPKVSFEEMKRLMRVYGPTKCLRNRTPKESGKCTKILSVKRKFYRWFPDFHERFVLQNPGAWYKPKIGHEEEMTYREDLRNADQEILAAKRNAGKNSSRIEQVSTAS
mmetsp:Transcript_1759/g.3773  ORF Transcript_1759/g.3773 Transcript_1759/m.3773 type:complete len:191 (-) Transcript_1759:104-676(-)|eukprot:CAMPEP_0172318962 /NCGR_PEP_ID=MMETSP1058-20130122/36334_1 /TAXON_ID=83371 /ORGANISM="Detonula confervacea, Strain CCMP 353" /LENGTH=190 /DNA_ID=CAMNT_0013033891 /DNA_START=342 /DNA_END=914 /DNA_ORIENTATION=+